MSMRTWSTLGGILAGAMVYIALRVARMPEAQCSTAAVTTLCAVWWIFESLPLPTTSLVPLAAFPILGVLTEKQAAAAYGDPIVLLFMGGFFISKAAEHCGAHRKIAESMLATIGSTSGPRILLAFMLSTAVISMWISNTATALMMLPVALAVVENDASGKLAVPLLLGVAYAASIGGIATPIGSPPNGVFLAVYRGVTDQTVPFYQWMLIGGAVAVLMLLAAWFVLSWKLRGVEPLQLERNGLWTVAQKRTLMVLGLAALAWITREIPFGGWSGLLDSTAAGDMTIAIVASIVLFLVPSGTDDGGRLLDWQTAARIPWGVLILFGGGIAIATAFESSGLSAVIGETVYGFHDWHPLAVTSLVCLGVTFLSEVTSNTATSNILMPILAAAAKANDMDPAVLMIPATLSNSLAFMMPVGTPPNAIVYASGRVRIADMVRYGLVLNLVGAAIVAVGCWQLLPMVLGTASVGGR
jgi:solute carrier family 13 (sodium-dependent dicarboxylate transporter), member 2/3/5